ncbi:M81 family metallopeptidase [Peribacillus kribbensis]|uniref:M81 family metallopeptidase n=1 Tax=Peribacillus kribbensis TaxID=356658 RepID=UPI0003FA2087|nr:M81 family metallopeptidase [Peribacillus kribbensis]
MKKLRIGVAFFYHESHSFAPGKTTLKNFQEEGWFKGKEIFRAYSGTKTEVGGFLDTLDAREDIEAVPLLCAAAVPSGMVEYETYTHIESEMIASIMEAGRLDGLLLALHGAMAVEGVDDPEAVLLKKIRTLLPHVPIAGTLDMHANLSSDMTDLTPYHFGFKTYPHIDMYDQGVNAARALLGHVQEDRRWEAAFIKIPMMPPSLNMRTSEGPMHELITLAGEWEGREGILNISIFGGFPYSDVSVAGASIIAIAKTKKQAREAVKACADRFWELKEDFLVDIPKAAEGVKLAFSKSGRKPVVLADISDNPLSCGSGDTTELLRELIRMNKPGTLFGGLTDPESIEICRQKGSGNRAVLQLGGKHAPEFGSPIEAEAEILNLSDGVFYNSGPFNQNLRVDVKGAAYIRVGHVDILLIGRPMSANDPEMFRHIGIEPADYKVLGLKVKNHFRAAFDPLIEEVIYVDAPGVASNDLSIFPYRRIPEEMWPFKKIEFPITP